MRKKIQIISAKELEECGVGDLITGGGILELVVIKVHREKLGDMCINTITNRVDENSFKAKSYEYHSLDVYSCEEFITRRTYENGEPNTFFEKIERMWEEYQNEEFNN